ncbi:amidohydrolase family protein, partial [Streptomyces sp. NPDC002491]
PGAEDHAEERAEVEGQPVPAREAGPGQSRLNDPVLLRHLLWSAVASERPLQLHAGLGAPGARIDRTDPALLTDFVRATAGLGTDLVLLHGYPYHRHAAHLAGVFPHVYADSGAALVRTGARAATVLAEILELAPFGKILFSTGAHGLPELHVVGALLFREALARVLGGWVAEGAWSPADAQRVAGLIAAGNARRVYGLG